MWTIAIGLLAAAGGIAAAIALGMTAKRHIRRSKRSGGLVLASAMLLGLGHVFGGVQEEAVQESTDETVRKKDAKAGDPPSPDENRAEPPAAH
jgi:hypothetical protein